MTTSQLAFSRPPSYQIWLGEESRTIIGLPYSPNTIKRYPLDFSRMTAGNLYAMQVTAFKIEPPQGNHIVRAEINPDNLGPGTPEGPPTTIISELNRSSGTDANNVSQNIDIQPQYHGMNVTDISLYMNNVDPSNSFNIVLDLYDEIDDPGSTNVATRFAGKSPFHTTDPQTIAPGPETQITWPIDVDTSGLNEFYIVAREENNGSTVNLGITGDFSIPIEGCAGGNGGGLKYEVIAVTPEEPGEAEVIETMNGKIIAVTSNETQEEQVWENLAQNNWKTVYYEQPDYMTVLGMFDSDLGQDFQSNACLITAPKNKLSVDIILAGNVNGGFLVNKNANTDEIEPLNTYSMCLSFWALNRSEFNSLMPHEMNRWSQYPITYYPDIEDPTPPLQLMGASTSGQTPKNVADCWTLLNKLPYAPDNWWLAFGSVYMYNTVPGATFNFEADIYIDIMDPADPDPAVAFAGLTPEYTTSVVQVPPNESGDYEQILFGIDFDNTDHSQVWMVIRSTDPGGSNGVLVAIDPGITEEGAADGEIGAVAHLVYGYNYYFTL